MSPTWEVKLPITGHVSLDLDFNGIQFKREKDRNIAILFVTAPKQQVLDEALDKCRRTLDKLALIYDEGLKTSNQGAIVNLISRFNKDGRNSSVNSFATHTISLLKNERHRDEEMLKLLSEVTDENTVGIALGLRTQRSLHWFNIGLSETDASDSFLSDFIAIECFLPESVDEESEIIETLDKIKNYIKKIISKSNPIRKKILNKIGLNKKKSIGEKLIDLLEPYETEIKKIESNLGFNIDIKELYRTRSTIIHGRNLETEDLKNKKKALHDLTKLIITKKITELSTHT